MCSRSQSHKHKTHISRSVYMEKPSFEMIQANKCEIFFSEKKTTNFAPTIHSVNGNKRPTVVSAVGSWVFNADMLRSRRAKGRCFHTDIY